jgi:plasmid segregation protein ParM
MILGVDLGNFAVKVSNGMIFPSKCSKVGSILNDNKIEVNGESLFLNSGFYDTEYRKVKKMHIKALFLYALSQAEGQNFKAVVGLPLAQYKQDKEAFKELLISPKVNTVSYKNASKKIFVEDVEVYPEGVAAAAGTSFEGVIMDIGGRTTDCCYVEDNEGVKKVKSPLSIPKGTLNLYSDFINALNARYSLDLTIEDAGRILKHGLKIDGEPVDGSIVVDVFREYVDELIDKLNVEFSLKTNNVLLVGGGSELLYKPIKSRIPAASLSENPLSANAEGFQRVGEQLWQ